MSAGHEVGPVAGGALADADAVALGSTLATLDAVGTSELATPVAVAFGGATGSCVLVPEHAAATARASTDETMRGARMTRTA
jgi:hypothetical protein